jgi:hypothetical protein
MSFKRKLLTKAQLNAISILKRDPNASDEELFTNLKQLNPDCENSDLLLAITKAKEALFKPEYLTVAISKEMDEWDKIEG